VLRSCVKVLKTVEVCECVALMTARCWRQLIRTECTDILWLNTSNQAEMEELKVGARYSCFEDFQVAFAKFCRDTNSIFTVFNSKSIDTENRGRLPNKKFPSELKYRFIKYTCKHYGSNRSKSRGLRPNQRFVASPFWWQCQVHLLHT